MNLHTIMTRSVAVALSIASLVGCSGEAPNDEETGTSSAELKRRSAFKRAVERKGNVFDVVCNDEETGEYAWTVRGFFQPDLYPQGSLSRNLGPNGLSGPFDLEFGHRSVVPTDSPEYLAVRAGTGDERTEIVFERTSNGLIGSGLVRGAAGSWTCEVWAKRYLDAEDRWTEMARAL